MIVDHSLTPVQQRNLEKAWNAKVLDRTGLILEIFGRRAQTKEGALQVELAHLTYQKGRLGSIRTHLERQRGGGGFLRGPGETQIEADRRALQEKILRVEELENSSSHAHAAWRRTQKGAASGCGPGWLYRKRRQIHAVQPADRGGVIAEDMLFATLDPTLRRIKLEHGETIGSVSDTVRFHFQPADPSGRCLARHWRRSSRPKSSPTISAIFLTRTPPRRRKMCTRS